MMSGAINMTRDGIIGNWSADDPYPGSLTPPAHDDISYLPPNLRAHLIDNELFGKFAVSSDGNSAPTFVFFDGIKLMSIKRPDDGTFQKQLKHLKTYADLREDRIAEIQIQIDDLLSFFGAVVYLDSERRRYTLELLAALYRLVRHIHFTVKHLCHAPRPIEFSPKVQPIIQTPAHSSFPSGHSVEAFAIATILATLRNGDNQPETASSQDDLFRLAARIADNRVVAGVHFPVDNLAGAALGFAVGRAFATLGGSNNPLTMDGANDKFLAFKKPFDVGPDYETDFSLCVLEQFLEASESGRVPVAKLLPSLWQRAAKEW